MIWVTNINSSNVHDFLKDPAKKDWITGDPKPSPRCSLDLLSRWGIVGIYKPEGIKENQFCTSKAKLTPRMGL